MPLHPNAHKYHAKAVVIDGFRFDSKAEATRYRELKLLEKAGEIWELVVQPRFSLAAARIGTALAGTQNSIGEYRGDFSYQDRSGRVVEDVKGFDTPLSKWKRKHLAVQYGITVQIIK